MKAYHYPPDLPYWFVRLPKGATKFESTLSKSCRYVVGNAASSDKAKRFVITWARRARASGLSYPTDDVFLASVTRYTHD